MTAPSRLKVDGRTGYCLAPSSAEGALLERVAPNSDWCILDTLSGMTDDGARDEIGRINVIGTPTRLYGDDAAVVLSGFVHWELSPGPCSDGTFPVTCFHLDRDVAIAAWTERIGAFLSATAACPMDGPICVDLYSVLLTGFVADWRGHQLRDFSREVDGEFSRDQTLGVLFSDPAHPDIECVLAVRAAIVASCKKADTLMYRWDGAGLDQW